MMTALLGLPVGFLLGVVVHRGDFCMHSATREVAARRPGRQVNAYLTALGVQLLAVNALGATGWLTIVLPPPTLLAAAVGGLVFGTGMVLAKG
jgi:uncharacterized membrane protein YedE/YeeE